VYQCGRWFHAEIKELAYDTILSESFRARGLIRPDYVRELLDQHCAGVARHDTRLWTLFNLELWYRMWIDGPVEAVMDRPAA